MQAVEWLGYLGALFTLATFSMTTMLRLRVVGIVANFAFIAYGLAGQVYPVLLLHLVLLPLNLWRLQQLLRLTRQIRDMTGTDFEVEWLKPYSRQRAMAVGEVLFRQGDPAGEMLFVLSGRVRAVEVDVVLGHGQVFGELGLVLKDHRRTQTVVCEEGGVLLVIGYDEVRRMYFQNPRFGYYFLELAAERLARDAKRSASSGQEHAGR